MASGTEELVGIGSYAELSKLTKGFEQEIQAHHLIEVRHLERNGFSVEQIAQSPACILTRAEHKAISNALEGALHTGKTYSLSTVLKTYKKIHAGHPDWLEAIDIWIKQTR